MQTKLEEEFKDLCKTCKSNPCSSQLEHQKDPDIQHIATVRCKEYKIK